MKKLLSSILAVVILISTVPTLSVRAVETVYAESKKTAQLISDFLVTTNAGISSVQYAVIEGDQIILSGQSGYAYEEELKPATAETMYGIASISKMFTTTAVMQLVEQGKVNLDSPVVQYIPEFVMKDERYRQITPRMLLNHSSGLMGTIMNNNILFDDNDPYYHDHLLEILSQQRLKAAPGAFSVYCNDGFSLAELLIERVSGLTYTEYIHLNITSKIGMNSTKTPLELFDKTLLARAYSPEYDGVLPYDYMNMIGAGGIFSTAEDLCKFATIFTRRNHLLSDQSLTAMSSPEYKKGLWMEGEPDNSLAYGLGWDSVNLYPFNEYEIKALVKGGDSAWLHSSMVVLPEKNLSAVFMTSGASSTINQMAATQVLLSVLQERGDIKVLKPNKTFGKPVKAAIPDSVKKNAGIYYASGDIVNITFGDSVLNIASLINPKLKYSFTHVGEGDFLSEDGKSKISFQTLSNGKTYLATEGYASIPLLGQTASAAFSYQKAEKNEISPEILEKWKQRNGNLYVTINEKYTSQNYFTSGMFLPIYLVDQFQGYYADKKFINENLAQSALQIPMASGRDLLDIEFFTKDGKDFVNCQSFLLMNINDAPVAPLGVQFQTNIEADGYAKWYQLPELTSGHTMSITIPEKSSFTVYNINGVCTYNSTVVYNETFNLPAGGYCVFAGEPGAQFTGVII